MLAVLTAFLLMFNPGPVGATNTVGDKTTEINITVNDNGNITTAGTFTVSDLQSMSQERNIYSTINNNTEKKFYATEGVLLTGLLAQADIDINNIDRFTFTATDNYARTFTKTYLLDTPRYCYPNLENNLSTEGAIQVQPVLALKSMEFSQYDQVDYSLAGDYYSVRLFFGQNEQDLVSDQGYVKWVSQIVVFTKPAGAQPPALTADMTHNSVGQDVGISFTDDQNWRSAITEVTVDGTSIAGKYSIAAGMITIDGSVFDSEKDYCILVKATGYQDAGVTQHKGSWPVIFTLDGNATEQHVYTAADLRAMPATTAQYGAHTCKGVALDDLFAAANITGSDWQAQINVTDAATFPIAPVRVADLLDPSNRYLLTYDLDGQPITTGPDNQTTLRIYWGIGITYKNVTGITITKAGNNGGGSSGAPAATGLVIGGTGITEGMGLLNSFVYLSQTQVDDIKANKSIGGLCLGSSWTSPPTLYSSYHNHGTPEYTYTLAEGINLKTALTALGADVTSEPVALEAKGIDNYDAVINDAFGKTASRNYIAPDGTVGAVVDPILIFYDNQVSTDAPGPDTVVPTSTAAITDTNPLFAYGQKEVLESNNCTFVKNTVKIRAGLDTPAFTITKDSTTKSISLSDIALIGLYQTSYFWDNGGAQVTQDVVGVPLIVLLTKLDITVPSDRGLTINVNNGSGTVASSRAISYGEINECFVAFDAFENGQRVSGSVKPLRLYCPGETKAGVLIENVVGAAVSDVSMYTVSFEENGGSAVTDITQASGATIDTAPVTTKDGYTFAGWYADEALASAVTFPMAVTGNMTLYAKWSSVAVEPGDVNSDGMVNILDVVQAVNYALGKATPNAMQFNAANLNGDGSVNILDVVQIVNKALGK
jgi:uncharacterized repeat protein (TIGR02543 family)